MKIRLIPASLCGVVVAFVTFPITVQAQQESAAAVDEVVVTGSRIPQNANLESASPVTQVDSDEFLYAGVVRVEDLLNDLPQVTGSNVVSDSNGATGTASVDLRDLGPSRTLTLMNGRRLPTGSPLAGGDGADLNFIPSSLVQRVEVLTGGGSATYGSDAIAGVVNFIMKDNLEGFVVDLQGSLYQHRNDNDEVQALVNSRGFDLPSSSVTDGESYTLSLAWGTNFADDRGNFSAYVNYRDTEAVTQSERDFSACALGGRADDGSLACGGSGTLAEGRFINLADGSDFFIQGDQFVPYDGRAFNFAPLNYFQRPDERTSAGFFTHLDFNENLRGYAEFGYMKNETLAQIAPSGSFFNSLPITCNNPLLSAQQRQILCGNFGLSGSDTQQVLAVKRNVEGGPRFDDIQHEQTRFVLGLEGQINENWGFDVSATYGKVELDEEYNNDLSIIRIGRSLNVVPDASGNPVCQSVVDGSDPDCVPWNFFETGGVTQDAIDYLTLPLLSQGDTKVTNLIGYVTGDLTSNGVKLPGADFGMQVVAGLEYRKDELSFRPDANFQSGDGAGQGGPQVGVEGSVAVNELFLEAQLPLTNDMNFGLGFRYSDYDTDQTTDSFKTTYDWLIVDGFKLRASYQSATRHANVRELFRPQGIGLFQGSDPCAGPTPTGTPAQCANSGVTAAQYGNVLANPAGQYNQLNGGNLLLEPEESDTYSVGFVWTPSFSDGFDMSIDWFSIDVQGAISTAGSQFLIDSCVFSGQFCDRINRGALGTLWLGTDNIVNTNANIGFQDREGIDMSANYSFEAGNFGDMRLSYNGAYVLSNDRQPVPDADIVDCNGFYSGSCGNPNPEYRHNMRLAWNLSNIDLTTTLAWRHHGKVDESTTNAVVENFGSQNYFDLAALWQVNDGLSLRFGINNLFDKEPPISGAAGGGSNNGNVEVTEYDVLGRYLFLGATFQL